MAEPGNFILKSHDFVFFQNLLGRALRTLHLLVFGDGRCRRRRDGRRVQLGVVGLEVTPEVGRVGVLLADQRLAEAAPRHASN